MERPSKKRPSKGRGRSRGEPGRLRGLLDGAQTAQHGASDWMGRQGAQWGAVSVSLTVQLVMKAVGQSGEGVVAVWRRHPVALLSPTLLGVFAFFLFWSGGPQVGILLALMFAIGCGVRHYVNEVPKGQQERLAAWSGVVARFVGTLIAHVVLTVLVYLIFGGAAFRVFGALYSLGWVIYLWVAWWRDLVVLTSLTIWRRRGVIRAAVNNYPLGSIDSRDQYISIPGRIFDWGRFKFDTPSQGDAPLHAIGPLAHPEAVLGLFMRQRAVAVGLKVIPDPVETPPGFEGYTSQPDQPE